MPAKKNLPIEYVNLTPAMAARWLDTNIGNRNARPGRVAKYAADMADGRWQLNGDTFKFDTDGHLIDGQHRCMAVVESGVTIPAIVIRDLDRASQQTLDAGAHRNGGDALFFAGADRQHAKDIAAALNVWTQWTTGKLVDVRSNPGGNDKLTNAAMVDAWRQNPEVAHLAVEAKAVYQRGLRLPVGAIAVALHELRKIDFDGANDFFDRIIDLRTAGKGDPIHTLITRIQDETVAGRRILPATALFMLFRTWNAQAKNEPLLKLQFGSSDSGWAPIPKPIKPKTRRTDVTLEVAA